MAVGVTVGVAVEVGVTVGVAVAVGVCVAVAVGEGSNPSEVATPHPVPTKENKTSASNVARASALRILSITPNAIDLELVQPLS